MTSLIAFVLLFMSTALNAAPGNSAPENTAYVDSVHEWGAWELGIEPAAGPLKAGDRPLNIRPSDTRFRPTDSHRFQTDGSEIVSSVPTPPPAPIIPPPPPTPIVPGIGRGNPGEGPPSGRP